MTDSLSVLLVVAVVILGAAEIVAAAALWESLRSRRWEA